MKKPYTKPVLTQAGVLSKMTALETCPSDVFPTNGFCETTDI